MKKKDASLRRLTQLKSLDADFAARLYKAIFGDRVDDVRGADARK